jgi:hypothetical protein
MTARVSTPNSVQSIRSDEIRLLADERPQRRGDISTGMLQAHNEAMADRIDYIHEYDWNRPGRLLQSLQPRGPVDNQYVRRKGDEWGRNGLYGVTVPRRYSIRTLRRSVQPSSWSLCNSAATRIGASESVGGQAHQHADPPHR